MSMTNLGLWFLCFWEVICPNWWTLAMVIAAVITFFVIKAVYAGRQIDAQGAMVHVGKRWQTVGYVIIAVVALIYAVELIAIHTMTRKIVADREKPQVGELQTLLRANEVYLSKLFQDNQSKHKGNFYKFRSSIIGNESFNIKEDITYADARRFALEKRFSAHLAGNPNIKLFKLYSAPSDSSMKKLVGEITAKRTGYAEGDHKKKFNDALFAEFAKPKYKDVLPRLSAELKKTIANREFKLEGFQKDTTTLWNEFCKLVNNSDGSFVDGVVESWAEQDRQMVSSVFRQKASADGNSKESFNDLLPGAKNELVRFLDDYRVKCFTPENMKDILREALRMINSDERFAGCRDNQLVGERKLAFWEQVNKLMMQRWKEDLEQNFIRGLEEKNDMLFSNDASDLKAIGKKWIEVVNFNNCLNKLLNIAVYLLNFFWFMVICIVVLVVFIARGKRIRNMGNVEKIKSKFV